ncbi:MAG: long-chain fatty acid--CoA ligase [Phycisphaerales bacterium]|nr:long-chain fatty acid--CoA ligase [Phycisphaerales bacterium]
MGERQIHTAPPGSCQPVLGRTLISLLDDACALGLSRPAVAEKTEHGEFTLTATELRDQADRVAAALLDAGFKSGGRIVLCMPPGLAFTVVDFACQTAGLIDVPLYETCRVEDLAFILDETEAEAVVIGGEEAIGKITGIIAERPFLKLAIFTDRHQESSPTFENDRIESVHLDQLIETGDEILSRNPGLPAELRAKVDPQDIATLIYTSGTTGKPKGVQLTQENVSYNGLTGFEDIYALTGDEVALSILPLAHVFQRTMHYAVISHGWPIYFCPPTEIKSGLPWARPTMFATVPRVLEKIREGIDTVGSQLTGSKRIVFNWAMALAERQEIGRKPGMVERLQLKIADRLVFSKWREALGGRLKVVVSGGAALDARIANFFDAFGVSVLQGFGLTETSTIVTFNRPRRNRAGTVGHPLPGVEVTIADDGEILTRGPHVTSGYFKRPDATAEAIDPEGWFHTGDIGEFDEDGFLRITDRKKNLFKLSTGRYVAPQPMEVIMTSNPLVNHALVTGADRKFVVALLFPEETSLRNWLKAREIDDSGSLADLFQIAEVQEVYQSLLDEANASVADFSKARRFALIDGDLSVENGLLTPTLKIRRTATANTFNADIERLYEESGPESSADNSLRDL